MRIGEKRAIMSALACLLVCLCGATAQAQYGPYVNGMFLIGLYDYPDGYWHADETHFGDIKTYFNTVDFFCHDGDWSSSPGENLTTAILDSAAANGLYITCEMWTYWDPAHNYCDIPSEFVVGSEFYNDLQTFGSHPALLMWAGQDEANTNYLPLATFDSAMLFMQANGKGKPVWLNEGGSYGNVSGEQPWAADCTVFSNDDYPDEGWGINGPMKCMDAEHQVVSSSVPKMSVLPGYPISSGGLDSNTMSYVMYTCIIHGAAGIWWWGCEQLGSTSAPEWQSIRQICSQLRQMQGALIHPTSYQYYNYCSNKWFRVGITNGTNPSSTTGLEALLVSDASTDYLLTANTATNSQTYTIKGVANWRGGANLWYFCGSGGANQALGQTITYGPQQVTVYASHAPPFPPVIGKHPVSLNRSLGGAAVFTVNAYGIQPLTYQWSKNGTAIAGQTSSMLTLTNLQPSDAASYSVTVTGPLGSTNSTAATLTLLGGYGAFVCGDQPVAYYPLNETSGTVARDLFSGCDGTYTNGPTLGVAGATTNMGLAVALNGQYIDISSNYAGLNFTGQITLEAWIKPSSFSGYIVAHSADANWNELWLRFDGSGNYQFGTWTTSGGAYVTVPVPAGTANNWVHLVGTYDDANWNVYQNGNLLGTQAGSGAIQISCDWGIGNGTGLAYGRFFTGSIQDVAIYNYALSPAQIQNHYLMGEYGVPVITQQPVSQTRYLGGSASLSVSAGGIEPLTYQWNKNGSALTGQTNATLTLANVQPGNAASYSVTVTGASGSTTNSAVATLTVLGGGYGAFVCGDQPAAYYPLNETSGTVAYDYMNGCNGTYTNSPTLGVAGATSYTGTAVALNGTSQMADLGNPAWLNFTNLITVEAWIKPSSLSGYIVAHSADSSWDELWLRFDGYGDYQLGTWESPTAYVTVAVPAGTLNNWVHVVGTYDGANWNVYQNGVLLGSATGTVGTIPISCDWGIGSGTGQAYGRFFTGSIQDVAIYNKALSPLQIRNHYLAGEYGTANPPLQVTYSGGLVTLTWPAGTLQQSTNVPGPYVDVPGATSPFNPPGGHSQQFYRVKY